MCLIFIISSQEFMILKFGKMVCICFHSFCLSLLIHQLLSRYTILGTPASTNIRNAKYPQILPDNRVVFKVKAPDAQKVQIDLGKKYDMVKDAGRILECNYRFNQ